MNSPKKTARIAGFLYLIIFACSIFSLQVVPSTLIVPGDAVTTANNIMASESLFRISFVGESVIFLSEIVLVVMLYVLFKSVSKTLSLVMVFSRLAMTVMQGMNLLNKVTALQLLSGADSLIAFEPDQLYALMLLFLKAHEYGALIWGTFFGLHLLVLGYLLFKSGYFPRILGVLFVFGSIGYLTHSFGNLVLPNYKEIYAWVVWATVPAEMLFPLWLLIKGVNVEQWEKRALESA